MASNQDPFLLHGLTKVWISNYIHQCLWAVITHSCPNLNGGLTEQPLKLGYGWKFHSIRTHMYYLIPAIMLFICIKKRDPRSLILDNWKFHFFDASTLERHAVTMYIIGANRGTKEPNPNVSETVPYVRTGTMLVKGAPGIL